MQKEALLKKEKEQYCRGQKEQSKHLCGKKIRSHSIYAEGLKENQLPSNHTKKDGESEEVVDKVVTNLDNLANGLSNMLAAYRSYLDNPRLLNVKELAHVRDTALVIQNVITRNNSNQIPPNKRYSRCFLIYFKHFLKCEGVS